MSIEKIERELRDGIAKLSDWSDDRSAASFRAVPKLTLGDIRALLDELSRLREALKPFAAAKGHFDGHVRDEDTVDIALRHIRARHVRAAARALSEREGQDG